MALIDASAAQVMELASDLLVAEDKIRRQRKTIWQLVTIVRAEQQAKVALVDLLDELLADLDA